jgi:hypothetical protein
MIPSSLSQIGCDPVDDGKRMHGCGGVTEITS